MKLYKNLFFLFLILLLSSTLYAAPEYSGKLAGTETAFIDNNVVNLGVMDSTYDFSEIISVKTNIVFDIIGLYNVGVKAGYHFKDIMDLRIALGYTGFYLYEAQMLTTVANSLTKESGITINSLNLHVKGQKVYFAAMLPLYGFNINTNYALYFLEGTNSYSKVTFGLEKTFLNNKLSFFVNGGMFFNLPISNGNAEEKSVYYNLKITNLYTDGGIRFYFGDHFNMDIGFIYPGIAIPLGNDTDTGEAKEFNLPILPVINFAYRF